MEPLNSMASFQEETINGMAAYLSKKINIPQTSLLQCCSWNSNTNFVAAGGTNGILKIVKFASHGTKDLRSLGNPGNLAVNQNLDGHSGTITHVAWNEIYQKLTSSDNNGLITVWTLDVKKDSWYEEMINSRWGIFSKTKKSSAASAVCGMAWNPEGTKICIAYQEGHVIVGWNEGNRLWAKDFPGPLSACHWAPDGMSLLFGTAEGEVHSYDMNGNFLQKLHIAALESFELEAALAKDLKKDLIVALEWWRPVPKALIHLNNPSTGGTQRNRVLRLTSIDSNVGHEMSSPPNSQKPILLVAYEHGVIQLMRGEQDSNAIVVRFNNYTVRCARWAPNGAFVGVAGIQTDAPAQERCFIQIMSNTGSKLCILPVPGNSITALCWDPTGLRMGITIDSNLYFCNIRPNYKWTYFGKTVFYVYEKPDRREYKMIFFETKMEETYTKSIKHFEQVASFDDYCIVVNRQTGDQMGTYLAQLCNGIGTAVDFKYIDVEPRCVAMNGTAAVIAGAESYFIWNFRLPKRTTINLHSNQTVHEDTIHMLDNASVGNELGVRRRFQRGNDSISAICMGDNFFLAACESGALFKISLANGQVEQRYSVPQNIIQMQLNCEFKRVATLDQNHYLQFFDLMDGSLNKVANIDRRDVSSFKWDVERADTIAYNEKMKMYVMKGEETEDPVNCTGVIAQFSGLTVRTVLMDYFLLQPDTPERKLVIDIEIKALREAKLLLERMRIQEATKFIDKNPHPRLWSLLAEVALQRMDIPTAEHAYVKLTDYHGLQFCKRLAKVQNSGVRHAEVAAHFGKLEEAEQIYCDHDRKDLAIDMYRRTYNWIKVLALLNTGGATGANEDQLRLEAMEKVGDYYVDRRQWDQAARHYEQARCMEKLVRCYLKLDDYGSLTVLAKQLPDGSALLERIGFLFGSAGLSEEATNCYVRCEKFTEALDICIQLNHWDRAVQLSKEFHLRDVDVLLQKYAEELTGSNERVLAAVQLFRRAGKLLEAAKIVFRIANEERLKYAECLRLKKLYVMAALLVEEFRDRNKKKLAEERGKNQNDVSVALSGLLIEDTSVSLEDSRMMDTAWRGAMAYHFYMLAHRQFYDDNINGAMVTAVHATEYDDILDQQEVYSLLALSACVNRQFAVASRAFLKLELLPTEEKEGYQQLAIKIFNKNPPVDTKPPSTICPSCRKIITDYAQYCPHCDMKVSFIEYKRKKKSGEQHSNTKTGALLLPNRECFAVCIASGRPLLQSNFFLCPTCKHRAHENEITKYKFCPLCHGEF